MEDRNLICIGCPIGCPITVKFNKDEISEIMGNTCPKGDSYARKEVTHPTRIVTSTVRLLNSKTGAHTVPCKTASDIPKKKVMDAIKAIKNCHPEAPIYLGQVLVKNVAGTGVNIIATKTVL